MYAYIDTQQFNKRILDPDDVKAICAAYPPGKLDPNCDPEPRHGFSTECSLPAVSSCAMAKTPSSRGYGSWGELLVGLLLTTVAARRRN